MSMIDVLYNLIMTLKNQFLRTYFDLPISERSNVIASIDGNYISWNVAKIEIEADTEIGKRVLQFLEKNNLLKKE